MTLPAKLLDELQERREKIYIAGGKDKIEKRHEKGLLTARERLLVLFQQDTFQEIGAHVRHTATAFGMAKKEFPADGIVAGTGYVIGDMPVAAFSQDFTVGAGTLGKMHASKMVDVLKLALKIGCPVVAFKDSGGARIQEAVDALSGYGEVFHYNVLASGVVPQIAVILGPCAGGASYSPALMDFIIMSKQNAHMFITGPEVIKAVTGQACSMDQVGGAAVHATVSGNAHFVAEDDRHAIQIVQKLLTYLPSNNTEGPPHRLTADISLSKDELIDDLIPEDPSDPLDVHQVIRRVVDGGELLEVHAGFARNLIVGFARVEGVVVGILANQPMEKAGALDIDASDKGARFIRFCNVFNIPLVTFVDVPGFLPGIEQERGGIIRHGAKMLYSYSSATVPKITLILRKAYGGAYIAMCSSHLGADLVYAWPTAEIAVMGAEGAVNILYRKDIKEAKDQMAKRQELVADYRAEFASPYLAASRGYITDVIEPSETRGVLALALRKMLTKRELRPAKKHGTIPL
uniref:Acetyl-CoA carboxylase, carboxyltransferase component n=1 Tax=Candidatus Kentrum sp. FW TaxID=2126338 RepID=A0A450SI55_9GAMM|nr:MAG: Acetyl-CoA carboxylase, carboxyltransferase component [Candidatus Kentron sp. FW]VFJ52955.1 MAG: Acetyl-CoA carboxylase, carboxyltransferase component [Candidatus Kentron sp. FW]